MKLYEYEAKKVFKEHKIPIPEQYGFVHSSKEVESLKLKFPVMVKAAVLVGGRGKAGGIKKANSLEEAKEITNKLLQLKIKGYQVQKVFFEEAVEEVGACYVGVTMDPKSFNTVLVASAAGGVDIEEVARSQPEAIIKRELKHNDLHLKEDIIEEVVSKLDQELQLTLNQKETLTTIIKNIYYTYQNIDAKLCEINPAIITPEQVIAADAKIVLDDNGLYRQKKLLDILGITSKRHDIAEPTTNEKRAYDYGFPYVDLFHSTISKNKENLYVALVPGGAGYGIFSIDEVTNIGDKFFDGKVVPINFMDSGGGPSQLQVAQMFHLLMDHPLPDIIITSRFGGISSCDVFIRGLIQALRERYKNNRRIIPIFGRMVGTDLPSAKKFLDDARIESPEALSQMTMVVGNEMIMADVIKDGIAKGFEMKRG